jgi:hypothetical protein
VSNNNEDQQMMSTHTGITGVTGLNSGGNGAISQMLFGQNNHGVSTFTNTICTCGAASAVQKNLNQLESVDEAERKERQMESHRVTTTEEAEGSTYRELRHKNDLT